MPFKKGQKRAPGAGRVKGVPNKVSQDFRQIMAEKGFSPAEALHDVYSKAMGVWEEKHKHKNLVAAVEALRLAGRTAEHMSQYTYPKLKSVEFSGTVGVTSFADLMKVAVEAERQELKQLNQAPGEIVIPASEIKEVPKNE